MTFVKNGFNSSHDRRGPRKTSIYKMTRKLIVQEAAKLGADGEGKDGYAGWVRSCIVSDHLAVLKILMTKRNKVTAIAAINNRDNDQWRLLEIEKLEAQGLLIEGNIINDEEVEPETN